MRKKTLEQKNYLESVGSFYAGFNSHRYILGKLHASEKPEIFEAIICFTNRATIPGINSKYSKGITDNFSLEFLNETIDESGLFNFYNQLAEFLDVYFNHLYLSQKNKKSFNIHVRYCLTALSNNNGTDRYKEKIDSEYLKLQHPDLKLELLEKNTVDKWIRDIETFKVDAKYIDDIFNRITLDTALKSELLKVFKELFFLFRFHKTYYLNLIRALRIIYEYETVRIFNHKSQKVALAKVAKLFNCSENNIRNILQDYRIQGIQAKVTTPSTSYIQNIFESIKQKYPEYFTENEIPKDISQ